MMSCSLSHLARVNQNEDVEDVDVGVDVTCVLLSCWSGVLSILLSRMKEIREDNEVSGDLSFSDVVKYTEKCENSKPSLRKETQRGGFDLQKGGVSLRSVTES